MTAFGLWTSTLPLFEMCDNSDSDSDSDSVSDIGVLPVPAWFPEAALRFYLSEQLDSRKGGMGVDDALTSRKVGGVGKFMGIREELGAAAPDAQDVDRRLMKELLQQLSVDQRD